MEVQLLYLYCAKTKHLQRDVTICTAHANKRYFSEYDNEKPT